MDFKKIEEGSSQLGLGSSLFYVVLEICWHVNKGKLFLKRQSTRLDNYVYTYTYIHISAHFFPHTNFKSPLGNFQQVIEFQAQNLIKCYY